MDELAVKNEIQVPEVPPEVQKAMEAFCPKEKLDAMRVIRQHLDKLREADQAASYAEEKARGKRCKAKEDFFEKKKADARTCIKHFDNWSNTYGPDEKNIVKFSIWQKGNVPPELMRDVRAYRKCKNEEKKSILEGKIDSKLEKALGIPGPIEWNFKREWVKKCEWTKKSEVSFCLSDNEEWTKADAAYKATCAESKRCQAELQAFGEEIHMAQMAGGIPRMWGWWM